MYGESPQKSCMKLMASHDFAKYSGIFEFFNFIRFPYPLINMNPIVNHFKPVLINYFIWLYVLWIIPLVKQHPLSLAHHKPCLT